MQTPKNFTIEEIINGFAINPKVDINIEDLERFGWYEEYQKESCALGSRGCILLTAVLVRMEMTDLHEKIHRQGIRSLLLVYKHAVRALCIYVRLLVPKNWVLDVF